MIAFKVLWKIIKIPYLIVWNLWQPIKKLWSSFVFKWNVHVHLNKRVKNVYSQLENQKEKYIGVCHPEWLGVRNSTIQIFGDERIEIEELYNDKEALKIAQGILDKNKRMVVFSGFAYGWDRIARKLKELDPTVTVKMILHGSNALLAEDYDWETYERMLKLYNEKIIDELAFVKKSLYEFYKKKGYNVSFVMNDVIVEDKEKYIVKDKRNDRLKIGLYSSGDRWVKNSYNQLAAASLFDNAEIDSVPASERIVELGNLYGVKVEGDENSISREEMYKKLANNDINLYVTFTECAPLIPLESLELGTICITGNNHHYFEGTELEKYLVVSKEDDIMAIYNQIKYALENKDRIFELYKDWKENYSREVEESMKAFLEIKE